MSRSSSTIRMRPSGVIPITILAGIIAPPAACAGLVTARQSRRHDRIDMRGRPTAPARCYCTNGSACPAATLRPTAEQRTDRGAGIPRYLADRARAPAAGIAVAGYLGARLLKATLPKR